MNSNMEKMDYAKHSALFAMLALPLALLFLFCYVPMPGLALAFKNYSISDGILGSSWCGFDNFTQLFGNRDFFKSICNTLLISLLRILTGTFAPVILALMLNEVRSSFLKRGFQTMTYMPYFFSWVVLGGIFLMLLSGGGPVNAAIRWFGAQPIPFLTDKTMYISFVIISGIWQTVGYGSVIYLAALSGVNPVLYEASDIDGASRWQQTWHITIPNLMPTIITLFILSLGSVLSAGFDQIYNTYNPTVYEVADIVDTYVVRRTFGMDYSLATAAGLFKSAVGMILVITVNHVSKKMSKGEQGVW